MADNYQAHSTAIDIARILNEIGDMLEIKGESSFKTRAYRRAAEALYNLPADLTEVWRVGRLKGIPGVGDAIAGKIDELMRTGKLDFYERLVAEIPPGLIAMTRIPEVGPRTALTIYQTLGVTSLGDLEAAAREGRLRTVPGIGAKMEQRIIAGIEALHRASDRLPIGAVLPVVRELIATLKARVPDITHIEAVGSLRRRQPTIGDIDILVTAANPLGVVQAFAALPQADEIISEGDTKGSIRLRNGMRVDLMVLEPARYGSLLQHFTGSRQHNIDLRNYALHRGYMINEYGLTPVGRDHQPSGETILCATEAEVYGTLGLPLIPPEIREASGEIEAAIAGRLPNLVTVGDLRGDLHMHSDWSDGVKTIEQMARAAADLGYKYANLTDHSASLFVANGLTIERVRQQTEIIKQLNAQFAAEGLNFRLLHGCEMEIKLDGSLDYPDEVLAELDVVVASVHAGLRQPRAQVTARMVGAMRNPNVDIIAHPSGRLLGQREPADLDFEQVIATAAETGTCLEINGSPDRLDLDPQYVRWGVQAGVMFTIDSDAHHPDAFTLDAELGVAMARRGWAEAKNILNTRPLDELLAYIDEASRRKSKA
ncbi:MAG: DNA polymerase/3'-5' exonuclease PolX [Candidatus Chloroheliales bacterium]|nr:MAG: DNA polymerase/3'-5' exonuclease PolX [Chloroflexota bacterium]